MRLLHPIMPYITEELWSKVQKSMLFADLVSIMFAPYPREDDRFLNPQSEERMNFLIRVIKSIRNLRQTYNVSASAEAEVIISVNDAKELEALKAGEDYIKRLAKVNPISISSAKASPSKAAREQVSSATIYIPLANLIDVEKSREKLLQRKQAVEKDITKVEEGLNRPGFKERAPQDKVEAMEKQLLDLKIQIESIQAQLAVLDEA